MAGEAGAAGGVVLGVLSGFLFRSMTVEEKFRSFARMAKDKDVNINTKAVMTVNLLRKLAGPRLPKTVWLEPPKAAPISAPLPDWSRIAPIMSRQTMTWIMTSNVYILSF